MVIDLTSEQEAQVIEVAALGGFSVGELLAQTAQYVLVREQEEDELLSERITDADRGNFLSQDEMDTRIRKILHR